MNYYFQGVYDVNNRYLAEHKNVIKLCRDIK